MVLWFLPGCRKCECGSNDDLPTPTLDRALDEYPERKEQNQNETNVV